MDKRSHSGQSYRIDGRPALTVLEGGRERTDSTLLSQTTRRRLGALGSIGVVAFGVALFTADKPVTGLTCEGEQVIPANYATQSEAVAENISGIDNARELGMVPVTTPDGSTQEYRVFMPNGAPDGSTIPTDCN